VADFILGVAPALANAIRLYGPATGTLTSDEAIADSARYRDVERHPDGFVALLTQTSSEAFRVRLYDADRQQLWEWTDTDTCVAFEFHRVTVLPDGDVVIALRPSSSVIKVVRLARADGGVVWSEEHADTGTYGAGSPPTASSERGPQCDPGDGVLWVTTHTRVHALNPDSGAALASSVTRSAGAVGTGVVGDTLHCIAQSPATILPYTLSGGSIVQGSAIDPRGLGTELATHMAAADGRLYIVGVPSFSLGYWVTAYDPGEASTLFHVHVTNGSVLGGYKPQLIPTGLLVPVDSSTTAVRELLLLDPETGDPVDGFEAPDRAGGLIWATTVGGEWGDGDGDDEEPSPHVNLFCPPPVYAGGAVLERAITPGIANGDTFAIHGGFGGSVGDMVRLDRDGNEIWRVTLGVQGLGIALAPNGDLYASYYNADTWATIGQFDPEDGSPIWTELEEAQFDEPWFITFDEDGNLVYGLLNANGLRRRNAATGALIGTVDDLNDGVLQVLRHPSGYYFVSNDSSDVYRLDANLGNPTLLFNFGGATLQSLVMTPDGRLFMAHRNPAIDNTWCSFWEFDTDGNVLWSHVFTGQAGTGIIRASALANGRVYVKVRTADADCILSAVDVDAREVLWTHAEPQPGSSSQCRGVLDLGGVVLNADTLNVYALNAQTGEPIGGAWPYPIPGGGAESGITFMATDAEPIEESWSDRDQEVAPFGCPPAEPPMPGYS
jgi:outer membrane protein assembly factor BamB